MTARTIAVIGAGLAGAKAAEAARASGYDGRVVLIGHEPHAPYDRPPLSKAVLRGEAGPATARIHGDDFYGDQGIEVLTGRAVESLEVSSRRLVLAGGDRIEFDTAVVATGAAPRHLDVPGADLDGVHYLRIMDDALRLRSAIRAAGRVAVIGAGWIGSEVAASSRQIGADVVLIDPHQVPLQRVLGREAGEVFRRLHADNGVRLRLGGRVSALRGRGTVEEVRFADDRSEAADLVVVGVGVTPEVGVAAGVLAVDNGVLADRRLETSVPGIYTAGDVANAFHPAYRRHLRIEHWANALNQGMTAGRNAAGGEETYERLPYFYSDQYDLGMEYVGLNDPADAVVFRGDPQDGKFVAFWHNDMEITAAMNVNVWDVVEDLKAIVASRRRPDLARLTDPAYPLSLLA